MKTHIQKKNETAYFALIFFISSWFTFALGIWEKLIIWLVFPIFFFFEVKNLEFNAI